jgi:hypothetical protein
MVKTACSYPSQLAVTSSRAGRPVELADQGAEIGKKRRLNTPQEDAMVGQAALNIFQSRNCDDIA